MDPATLIRIPALRRHEPAMLHIVRLLERRHPAVARVLVPALVVLLSAALALGVALLALR